MPELPISDGKGNLLGDAEMLTFAYTMYPRGRDEERREQWLLTWRLKLHALARAEGFDFPLSFTGPDSEIELRRMLVALWSLPKSPKKFFEDELKARTSNGFVASELLLMWASIAEYNPEIFAAPLTKEQLTAAMVEEHWRRESVDREGNPFPCNERTYGTCWANYKSVAHIWAARKILVDITVDLIERERRDGGVGSPAVQKLLLNSLAVAESLRQAFDRSNSRRPVLPIGETWTAPADLRLPPVLIARWVDPEGDPENEGDPERYRPPGSPDSLIVVTIPPASERFLKDLERQTEPLGPRP